MRTAVAAAIALAALFGGCGQGSSPPDRGADRPGRAARDSLPSAAGPVPDAVAASSCPPAVRGCLTAEGRIVYVERVDPDGDGDAHFVIRDPQGITLPGLTAIDVRKGLRPAPLPEAGDLISAAGPVQTGSYGQSQIHAIELHVAGR